MKTYKVIIPENQIRNFPEYEEWINGSSNRLFSEIMKQCNPEILSVSYASRYTDNVDRIFEFESEEHYTWFLLRR